MCDVGAGTGNMTCETRKRWSAPSLASRCNSRFVPRALGGCGALRVSAPCRATRPRTRHAIEARDTRTERSVCCPGVLPSRPVPFPWRSWRRTGPRTTLTCQRCSRQMWPPASSARSGGPINVGLPGFARARATMRRHPSRASGRPCSSLPARWLNSRATLSFPPCACVTETRAVRCGLDTNSLGAAGAAPAQPAQPAGYRGKCACARTLHVCPPPPLRLSPFYCP